MFADVSRVDTTWYIMIIMATIQHLYLTILFRLNSLLATRTLDVTHRLIQMELLTVQC